MNADPRGIPELPEADEAPRDGIEEEDNPVPLWFNVGFYGLIVVGIVYSAYYILSGWSQAGQYRAEVERAEARYAAVRAELPSENPFHGDASAIAEGKETFATICAACHLADGTGLVGPSLVDGEWKYGGSDADLYESVADGRPLGMPPWGAQLGSEKIWKVLAFMETLPRQEGSGSAVPTSGVEPSGAGTGSP